MASKSTRTYYLAGNPNSGKTSVFNVLTGLHQKTGNFPGVTVEKKEGTLTLDTGEKIRIIDLPGAYSFYPTSMDERMVVQTFADYKSAEPIERVIYVADILHIEKHLLLMTQIIDSGANVILLLNMADQAKKKGIEVDCDYLRKQFNIPVFKISARTGENISSVRHHLLKDPEFGQNKRFYTLSETEAQLIDQLPIQNANVYQKMLLLHHHQWLPFLSQEEKSHLARVSQPFDSLGHQIEETTQRYSLFVPIVAKAVKRQTSEVRSLTDRFDKVVTNPWLGPILFFGIIFFVFQAIFSWAGYPMDFIDNSFTQLSSWVKHSLPDGWFRDLLTDGLIAGLGGIVIFIPQIAILFLLIGILDEIGYMSRAVYLFDKLMQRFGLSGRSIVALISGGACAIPAIMTARTISNWKERLATILVTPFISCSARIPVYVLLVGMAVPDENIGPFNLQGLAFSGLYVLGILAALLGGLVLKYTIKTGETGYLALQLPSYKVPVWRNIFINMWEKTWSFVIEAGKIILLISIILWAMASYGPKNAMHTAEQTARQEAQRQNMDEESTLNLIASAKLEHSYAGIVGKAIEPAIRPLGYDWKIGIALITSFAAREVFVGTMSTIYSLGDESDTDTLRQKISKSRHRDGTLVFSRATSFSLLIFYVFAMQCMGTLAVVRRETGGWKWPITQFVFMTGLAYVAALLVYWLMA